jgi:hypothetical protein
MCFVKWSSVKTWIYFGNKSFLTAVSDKCFLTKRPRTISNKGPNITIIIVLILFMGYPPESKVILNQDLDSDLKTNGPVLISPWCWILPWSWCSAWTIVVSSHTIILVCTLLRQILDNYCPINIFQKITQTI